MAGQDSLLYAFLVSVVHGISHLLSEVSGLQYLSKLLTATGRQKQMIYHVTGRGQDSGDTPKTNVSQLARILIFHNSKMVLVGFSAFWHLRGRPQMHDIWTLGSHGASAQANAATIVSLGSWHPVHAPLDQ